MAATFLDNLTVVEVGDRQAVGSCGALLAELGATVILIEPPEPCTAPNTKWVQRAAIAAGKRSVVIDPAVPADREWLRRAMEGADVVLASSDRQPSHVSAAVRGAPASAIVCDITAFGSSGPLTGRGDSDFMIQAMAGAMDISGAPEAAPTPTRLLIMEMAAANYAAAGVLAAVRVRRTQGVAQQVEIALFDCAVSMLATFLSGYFVGREPQRIGNHHVSMSPWNAFRAADGWVLMCSGSDDQWRRVCDLIECPQLVTDPRYATPTSRVKNNAEVDAIVEAWTRQRTVAACIDSFNTTGLACGPVYTITDLFEEPALRHRGMICGVTDPATGRTVRLPGSVFRGSLSVGRTAIRIPVCGADREEAGRLLQARGKSCAPDRTAALRGVLAGLRVIEIGNYTTAPFAARTLASLGADVVKLEPPGGDAARALPPHRDGQGYFFTMNNSGKRSLMLDLRNDEGKQVFRQLLLKADVLVENLKPGSLARLGFGAAEIAQLNPRLVYCPISGFGFDSPYADRAAMDTTIQAMSGIMDLTQAGGVPYKTGISSADLAGGQFGVVAILAALEYRDRTGRGQVLDLSMQDGAAWLTHTGWNDLAPATTCMVHCSDGYVAVEASAPAAARVLGITGSIPAASDTIEAADLRREEVVERLRRGGSPCAPVLRISEVATHSQTQSRQLIVGGKSAAGVEWPLLACPIRLAATPAFIRRAIGALGADGVDVLAAWLADDGAGDAIHTGERSHA